MTNDQITSLFDKWNQALATKDAKKVTALYAEDAILLPTLSNQVRHNQEEIQDYFEHFLKKSPTGRLNHSNVRIFGDIAINSGVYTFAFSNGEEAQARFTFVYRKYGEAWKIIEHHSSKMPEMVS